MVFNITTVQLAQIDAADRSQAACDQFLLRHLHTERQTDAIELAGDVLSDLQAKDGLARTGEPADDVNRPGLSRHRASSLRNVFQTLPVTADC
jgi:hypothetical protein